VTLRPTIAARIPRMVPLLLTAVALLTWSNLVVPSLPADGTVRAALNVAGALGLLAVARGAGVSWHELGIGRHTWRAGLRWGGGALAVIGCGYAAVLLVAPHVLANPQVAGSSTSTVLIRALVLIPLGTVLAEEIAFRGVLHVPAVRVLPARVALAVTSVTFGLWHVVTALGPSAVAVPATWRAAEVVGIVVFTALGGLLLGWLRHRTGSLLAPMGLHLGTNVVGLVAAVIALH
jgi:uncharacterized protein